VSILKDAMSQFCCTAFLNDYIIDFWFMWLLHNKYKDASTVYVATSHFYTALLKNGIEEVCSWTENIDIFQQVMFVVPVDLDQHWSLCIVMNPGATAKVESEHDNYEPCYIF
jgi:Ulp1 family protease